jgi:hypothetical protein
MKLEDMARRRLQSQALVESTFNSPEEALSWMAAVQGQDYAGAKWAVGLRLQGSTEKEIENALADRAILRTWMMRGTLQLVAPADILWILALVGPRVIAGNARRYRELELDEKTLQRGNKILAEELHGEAARTRRQLLGTLNEKGISTEGQRGVYLLQRASLEGLICQGKMEKNNALFFSLEGFPQKKMSRGEAAAELARRYFASRGPATLQDFTWWSGLPAGEARAALESIQAELKSETLGGKTYWQAETESASRKKAGAALLLPGFDEFLIAYQDRSASMGERKFMELSRGGGMLPGTICLDGQIKGTWKRTFKKGKVKISFQPFESLKQSEKARVNSAAQEYGRFVGLEVEIW